MLLRMDALLSVNVSYVKPMSFSGDRNRHEREKKASKERKSLWKSDFNEGLLLLRYYWETETDTKEEKN